MFSSPLRPLTACREAPAGHAFFGTLLFLNGRFIFIHRMPDPPHRWSPADIIFLVLFALWGCMAHNSTQERMLKVWIMLIDRILISTDLQIFGPWTFMIFYVTFQDVLEAAGDQSITIPGDVFSRSADLAGWRPHELQAASSLAGAAHGSSLLASRRKQKSGVREVRTGEKGKFRWCPVVPSGAPELAKLVCTATPIAGVVFPPPCICDC